MNTYDERIELNRITLLSLEEQRREIMTLIDASILLNRKGLDMPLIGIETVLAEMYEAYTMLQNNA
jgi:hypothetical protein